MTRKLNINVQIDQLPDVAIPGETMLYFGVRLSAFGKPDFLTNPAAPDRANPATDRDMLLPWQWTGADAAKPATWDPHNPTSWKAWWVNSASPTIAPANEVTVSPCVNSDDSAVNPADPHSDWGKALNAVVQNLASSSTSLEAPGSVPVSDRTLFGFVESLSAFPSPWPEAHKVWTCLKVAPPPPAPPGDTRELFVVPVFGINRSDIPSGTYTASDQPVAGNPVRLTRSGDDNSLQLDYIKSALTMLDASATVNRLEKVTNTNAQILLEQKFLVKKDDSWARNTDQDWMIQLPSRIADILDPTQAFARGLDQVLTGYTEAAATAADQRTPLQNALVAIATDPAQRAALRLLLGAANWRVLAPCATGTSAMTPLAVALARTTPNDDTRNLLGGLTARDAVRPVDFSDTLSGFITSEKLQVWTDGHVLNQLGVTSAPPSDGAADWGPTVDTPDGLRSFLIGHWATPADPAADPATAPTLATTPLSLMRLSATTWDTAHAQTGVDANASIGLLDPSPLRAANADPAQVGNAKIAVSFTLKFNQADTANVARLAIVADLMCDGNATPLASVHSDPIPAGNSPGSVVLDLSITVPPKAPAAAAAAVAIPKPTFAIVLGSAAPKTVDISDPGPSYDPDFAYKRLSIRLSLLQPVPPLAVLPKVQIVGSGVSQEMVKQLLANTPDTALRRNAALAYVAPFMPMILNGALAPGAAAALPPASPPDAIAAALADWARYLFATECAAAIAIAENLAAHAGAVSPIAPVTSTEIAAVTAIFQEACETAINAATLQAQAVVPKVTADDALYAVSVKATPIVFPIDQPQPFEARQDIWTMFAGIGMLAGFANDAPSWPPKDLWYSLNIASMFVPSVDSTTKRRQSLVDATIIPGPNGPFDPVPYQISEIGGVRAANMTYENRSLVAEMPHEPVPVASGSGKSYSRRIEAYGFPRANSGATPKLPALCFGKRYFFLPYLIGHGGALPVCLRDPWKVNPRIRDPKSLEIATALRGNPKMDENNVPVLGPNGKPIPDPNRCVHLTQEELEADLKSVNLKAENILRTIDYRRTTPIAAPRVYSDKALPGIPDSVDALASEIPITPTPITLASHETAYFYCKGDKTEGVLDFASADPAKRVLQIDFGGLLHDSNAVPDLQLAIGGSDLTNPLPISGDLWPGDRRLGLRIVISSSGVEALPQIGRQQDDPFVERPPLFGRSTTIPSPPIDLSKWRSFYIKVINPSDGDATLLPPIVSIGTALNAYHQLTDPQQIPLPETSQHKRVINVLDGIRPVSSASNSVALKIRRPAVEFSTFERWINWDLTDANTKASLDGAYARVAQTNPNTGDDLTIDDPAVERVAVELVELFPQPQMRAITLLAKDWSVSPVKYYKTDRSDDPTLPVRVAKMAADGTVTESANIAIISGSSGYEVILEPGGVYEIRIYGAVRDGVQKFFGTVTAPSPAQRFGKGVWQGLRKLDQTIYRLGTPLVLTFEVATATMPALYNTETDLDAPFSGDRRIALSGTADKAQIGLRRDFLVSKENERYVNYPAIRYVNRVSLYSQRWGWRGRPLGTTPDIAVDEPPFSTPPAAPGFGQQVVDYTRRLGNGSVKDFESIAFAGRRDDDIGVIEETKLRLAHVLVSVDPSNGHLLPAPDPRNPLPPSRCDSRAPLFIKDLQYRGGANWWRFALGATSRYAAMRPNLDLTSYSHINPDNKFARNWHTLVVRDRDTGRVPKRPSLLLVLPLTETVMSDSAVPPLLAIFSEPMFTNFHIGDGIEAALDYARHPLPDFKLVWNGGGDAAQAAMEQAAIASAYAALASLNPKSDDGKKALQTLRIAVANYNVHARKVESAGAALDLTEAATALAKIKQENPQLPNYQTRLKQAQSAFDDANTTANNAAKNLQESTTLATAIQGGAEQDPPDIQPESQRFWPQVGPDVILTGLGHSGRPVPIRLDGPIGYTFDLETEAPNFGRSGFLVTPLPGLDDGRALAGQADTKIRPWTFARLRFRRLESVELSLSKANPVFDVNANKPINLLLNSTGIADAAQSSPPEFHEGLALDFPQMLPIPDVRTTTTTTVNVVQGPVALPDGQQWIDRFVQLTATVAPDAASIFINTDLGPAGTYNVALRSTSAVRLRVVLSQRDKPEQSDQPYEPVLDVSIRLLIDDGDEGLVRSLAGNWMTVACVPLLAGGKAFKPADPIYVNIVPKDRPTDPKTGPQVYGIRLTPFTPPLWCQFTQDVSKFDLTTVAGERKPNCSVANLAVTLKNNVPTFTVSSETGDLQGIQSIRWIVPGKGSQIGCVVAAIVTEFITDAFDRVRERPVAVYRIVDGTTRSAAATMQRMWQTQPVGPKPTTQTNARVRLMTLMYLQLDPSQPPNPPASLADYFNEPFDETISMTAADAVGRILGVSKPIEVTQVA